MDITETLAAKSDQLDAVDLLGNPQTFTITEVLKGNAEQPVQIRLAEFPRVWRPGKSMRRVMASCWGVETDAWVGHQVTLYCDETVRFCSEVVGGTRISHMTGIDGPKKIPLIVKKGQSATYTVRPLAADPKTAPTAPLSRRDELVAEWNAATPERRAIIEAEVAELDKRASA